MSQFDDEQILPPVPMFKMNQVFAIRTRLVEEVVVPFFNNDLTGEIYSDFVDAVWAALPDGIVRHTVEQSCRDLLTKELTPELATTFAWRIAGNIRRLQQGRPAVPWTFQQYDEWSPAQITRVWPHRNHRGEPGHLFSVRILAGTACPLTLTKFWSRKASNFFSLKLGFSRAKGRFPYSSSMQFVGLRMVVLLERVISHDMPAFRHVVVPPVCMEHNRHLLRARIRRNPPCPRDYSHACHQCTVGFTDCPFGTHRVTFVTQDCPVCETPDTLFDPEMSLQMCRRCFIQQRLREE